MCFGDEKQVSRSEKSIPAWLETASQENIGYLKGMRDQGYQSYEGPRVADLSSDEVWGNQLIRSLAGTQNPYTAVMQGAFNNAATAGPQSVSTVRAIDNVPGAPGGAAGSTQDYMDPYVAAVLAPQLRQIDEAAQGVGRNIDREATMAGAFGDSGHGIRLAQNDRDRVNSRVDATGRTYSDAFRTALATKSADINRNLQTDLSNATLAEQAFARALAGGQALGSLDKYNTGRSADLASLVQRQGATERGIDQGKLDANYAEFQRGQNYPLEISKLIASAIYGTPYSKTETNYQNDYSGYGMLGALAGTALQAAPMLLSDIRAKENIRRVGALADGQIVYAYNYRGDPATQIGLIAQEVERIAPDAVVEIAGLKHVDYAKATSRAAAIAQGH